jgi:hypothetical protein
MGLQAQQIVSLATQIAKCPGFTSQAGQFLNMILSDLCQDYDFDIIQETTNFNFNLSNTNLGTGFPDTNGYAAGCGPNPMPADFLRVAHKEAFYNIQGTIYKLIGYEKFEFDQFVQSAGNQSYPSAFYVDVSQTPPQMYVYWPAGGAYPATVRYYPQKPDITTPETSTTVPWFPNTTYLVTRLAGELMRVTGDARVDQFIGGEGEEGEKRYPSGANAILRRYLRMKDDPENKVRQVSLDRRYFRGPTQLKNTKVVGW